MASILLAKLSLELALAIINGWLYDIHGIVSLDFSYCSHENRSELLDLIADTHGRLNLLDVPENSDKKFDHTKQSELLTRLYYVRSDTKDECDIFEIKLIFMWKHFLPRFRHFILFIVAWV
jgi:hypothetical protein